MYTVDESTLACLHIYEDTGRNSLNGTERNGTERKIKVFDDNYHCFKSVWLFNFNHKRIFIFTYSRGDQFLFFSNFFKARGGIFVLKQPTICRSKMCFPEKRFFSTFTLFDKVKILWNFFSIGHQMHKKHFHWFVSRISCYEKNCVNPRSGKCWLQQIKCRIYLEDLSVKIIVNSYMHSSIFCAWIG